MPLHRPVTISRGRATWRRAKFARGFSLVEVLVAMTILVVLAAVIVPRFGAVRRSEAMLAGDQIEDVLRMWAFRSSIGTQQVGIWRRPDTGLITIMVRDYPEGSDPAAGDAPQWDQDHLSNAVRLPSSVEIVDVQINHESQNVTDWFVQTNPDRSRPHFLITLRDSSEAMTTVSIEPYSNAPSRLDAENSAPIRQPIDLDAEGEERMPW